jgi:ferredoxin, 2Fe-2S
VPTISFAKKNRSDISCQVGDNLMKTLLKFDVPVASSCGGDGVCAKCRIKIVIGKENLSQPSELELRLLSKSFGNDEDRISCQTQVIGDITIDAGYW